MPNKTVVISGANGYFGGIACQYFHEQGWSVLKATRQTGADIYCDLDHPEQLAKTKTDYHADVFIHAAAAHEVTCREQPYRSIFYNVAGTRAALDFCVLNNIQHFVYLSTFHVFGNAQGMIDESTVPCPLNDYGLSHLQAEQYVQMYNKAKKVKGLVVRPSNFFGIPANLQACDRWTLIPLAFCREAVETNRIILKTAGLQERNFVSVQDICEAIEKAVDVEDLETLHVFGQDTLSVKGLAELVQTVMRDELGKDISIKSPPISHVQSPQDITSFTYTSLYLHKLMQSKDKTKDFIATLCVTLSRLNLSGCRSGQTRKLSVDA